MASRAADQADESQSASASSTSPQKLYLKPSDLARKLRDVERQIAEELERTEQYQAMLRVSSSRQSIFCWNLCRLELTACAFPHVQRLRANISEHDQQLRDVQLKLDCFRGVERQHGGDDGDDNDHDALGDERTRESRRQHSASAGNYMVNRAVKDGIAEQLNRFMRTPLSDAEDAFERIQEQKC